MIVNGMLFPASYNRPQYTDAEERRHEAEQALAEEAAPDPAPAWLEELPEAHP